MTVGAKDLKDVDVVDAVELISDGTATYEFLNATVVSVVSGVVTISGADLRNPDFTPEENDIVVITGNTAADGSYTYNAFVSQTTFTVNEAISDGTGGTVSFRHPVGATKIGVNPTNIDWTSETILQDMLEDIAGGTSIVEIDQIQASALLQTTAGTSSPTDAFSGSSLSVPYDGNYLALMTADCRVTNNNGIMGIGIGYNGINLQTNSEHQFEGNDRGSATTVFRFPSSLTTGDTIHGVFFLVSAPGTAQIRNRSLTFFRIA